MYRAGRSHTHRPVNISGPDGTVTTRMTSLLILATLLVLAWLWATWRRAGGSSATAEWSYVLLVAATSCIVMALGLWLR